MEKQLLFRMILIAAILKNIFLQNRDAFSLIPCFCSGNLLRLK